MTKAEIEHRVQELHRVRPVDSVAMAKIEEFLESLPADERLYAGAYGARMAEEEIKGGQLPEPKE